MRKSRPRYRAATSDLATVRLLVDDIAAGIRVLQSRDGVPVSDDQILERARNIVTALIGNYRIMSVDVQARRAQDRDRDGDRDGNSDITQLELLDRIDHFEDDAQLEHPHRDDHLNNTARA